MNGQAAWWALPATKPAKTHTINPFHTTYSKGKGLANANNSITGSQSVSLCHSHDNLGWDCILMTMTSYNYNLSLSAQ